MKTQGLRQALDKYGFDAAFGGARRDEEKSRAKERIFSFRSADIAGIRSASGPSPGGSTTRASAPARASACSRSPTGPRRMSGTTSPRENIPVVPLYFAAPRPVVRARRHADHARRRAHGAAAGRDGRDALVRFRTLGCYPLTGAVESNAATPAPTSSPKCAVPRPPNARAA